MQSVVEAVEGLSAEEAEDKLQQAFGWGPRANKFWRGTKVWGCSVRAILADGMQGSFSNLTKRTEGIVS